jgi:hypothetical protein
MMKKFYLMYYKCSKLKVHLVKSYLTMDLFDTLTFAEILGRTTFFGTLSLIVLL